jgi:hypothetical protein
MSVAKIKVLQTVKLETAVAGTPFFGQRLVFYALKNLPASKQTRFCLAVMFISLIFLAAFLTLAGVAPAASASLA